MDRTATSRGSTQNDERRALTAASASQTTPTSERQPNLRSLPPPRTVSPEPILLEDRSGTQATMWARDIGVTHYELVGHSYVMWCIEIITSKGAKASIWRRFSEFWDLRQQLLQQFPQRWREIPSLPNKSVVMRFDTNFLSERKRGLDYFIKCIVLNEHLSQNASVREFCARRAR